MGLFGKKKKQSDEAAPDVAQDVTTDAETAQDEFAAADLVATASATGGLADDISALDAAQSNGVANGSPHGFADKHHAVKKGAIVGLNIGSNTIKAIELKAKGGEVVVTAMGMAPTPAESIANGVVMSAGAISHAVRDLFAQSGIKTKQVVTSVAGTNALVVRVIEVPKMSDAELKDNLAMDADRYIPFPAAEVVMDHQALRELPSSPDAENMEVLLAAAQSEVVDAMVKVTQDAKLDPRAIDVEPLAAARAIMPTSGAVDYNNVTAMINIGAAGTEISVLRGDVLVFTRSVPAGGDQITQALVDYLGLTWQDAEHLKRHSADAIPPAGMGGAVSAEPAPFDETAFDTDFNVSDVASSTPAAAPAVADEGDWDDFGAFDESTPEESTPEAEAVAPEAATPQTPAPAASSADPFDLDFFDQGPQKDEPTEQHGQKEPDNGESSGDKPTGGGVFFSFDNLEEKEEGGGELPTRAAAAAPEMDDDLADLPAVNTQEVSDTSTPAPRSVAPIMDVPDMTSTPSSPSAAPRSAIPSAFDFAFDEEESDEFLPAVASEEETQAPALEIQGQDEDEFATLPAVGTQKPTAVPPTPSVPATPPAPPPAATTSPDMPISFEFEGSETPEPLPAREAEATAEDSTPLAVGEMSLEGTEEGDLPAKSAALDFDFDTTAAEPAAPSEASARTEMSNLDLPAMQPTSEPAAPAADDFDLDELFGDTAALPVRAAEPVLSAAPAAPTVADGIGAESDTMDFDLETLGAGLSDTSDGGVDVDAQTLYSIVQPALDGLIGEVRRSLEYHASRAPDAPVRQIVLVGGGACLKNIDAYFTQALGMPATIGDPLAYVTVQTPKLGEEYLDKSPSFAVALGLGLRELV